MTLDKAAQRHIERWVGHPIAIRGGIGISPYNMTSFTIDGMVIAPQRDFKATTLPESHWEWDSGRDLLIAHGPVVCETHKPYERLGMGTHHGQLGCGVRHKLEIDSFKLDPTLKGEPPVFFMERLPDCG